MTRPKREGDKIDKAIASKAELLISVEEFMRTRDTVVTSLTTLQSAIGDLLRAYLAHTTSVLGGTASSSELTAVTANIISNTRALEEGSANVLTALPPLPAPAAAAATATSPVLEPGGKKKKRKSLRKKKDPNAPKAPPTAYFLYAQSARARIKEDLGEDAKGNAVTEEASRRWNALPAEDQQNWKDLYKMNFADYKVRLNLYNATKAAAGEEVIEAEEEQEDHTVDAKVGADALAAAVEPAVEESDSSDASSDSDSDSDSDVAGVKPKTPPPAKETALKRGKLDKANGMPLSPTAEKVSSPEKKRRAESAAVISPEEPNKKKTRKGKGPEELAAPVARKEMRKRF